jgi:hypothetical protein
LSVVNGTHIICFECQCRKHGHLAAHICEQNMLSLLTLHMHINVSNLRCRNCHNSTCKNLAFPYSSDKRTTQKKPCIQAAALSASNSISGSNTHTLGQLGTAAVKNTNRTNLRSLF